MIDIASLKEMIQGDEKLICEILEQSGYYDTTLSVGEVRCAVEPGGSNKVRVATDTLASVIFGTEVSGDIITLVEYQAGVTFRGALTLICNIMGITDEDIEEYEPKTHPFGDFFDEIDGNFVESDDKMEILPEDEIYQKLLVMPSKMFLDDNVSIEQQKRFKIAYDYYTDRICIPYRNSLGDLVGIEGRLNKEDVADHEVKYFPIYRYPKSKVLFGYYENYKYMIRDRVVVIVESAKSVMKMADMGYNFAVATGKSHISEFQGHLIKALNPKLIIIAFDEDVEEAALESMAIKLQASTPYSQFDVGYVKDRNNKYLPKGSKMAPMDMPKDIFDKIMSECVIFVERSE